VKAVDWLGDWQQMSLSLVNRLQLSLLFNFELLSLHREFICTDRD
jgi:hypothetical protein